MAYNANLYQPIQPNGQNYYPNMPVMQQSPMMPMQQTYNQQMLQPPALTCAYVQGEIGARSFLVAANNTVVLLDSETIDTDSPIIYIKSTGPDNKPLPMRKIIGTSTYSNEQGLFMTVRPETQQPQIDLSEYSKKTDVQNEVTNLNARLNSIEQTIGDLNGSISSIDERFSNMFNAANSPNSNNNTNNNNFNNMNRNNNHNSNNRKGNQT